MALIKCSECGGEISDKAAACPKCGAPAKPTPPPARGPKHTNWKLWGPLLLVVFAMIGLSAHYGESTPRSTDQLRWAPSSEDIAKQSERRKLIDKMGRSGLYSKWETCETIDICVWVRGPFYALDIDRKRDVVQVIWSYHAVERKSDVIAIRLRDAQSGKDVGHFERQRLTMN